MRRVISSGSSVMGRRWRAGADKSKNKTAVDWKGPGGKEIYMDNVRGT